MHYQSTPHGSWLYVGDEFQDRFIDFIVDVRAG
jgi:hypothetical protein